MLIEEHFENICHDHPTAKEKLSQWNVIKIEVINKLNTVCTHFPHFSRHDQSHSRKIEEQIGKLLGHERIAKLSRTDLLMMLGSFYLHDIGMALEYDEIYEEYKSSDFQEKIRKLANDSESELQFAAKRICEFPLGFSNAEESIDVYNYIVEIIETNYRGEHASRSAKYVKKHEGIRQCLGVRCQKILADICDMHQRPISDIMRLPQKDNGLFNDYVHPRFLAAMLCLGDLLDLDTDRFDEASLKAAPPMARLSKLHKKKHESITRFLVEVNKIYIQSDVNDEGANSEYPTDQDVKNKDVDNKDVYLIMRQWLDWIEESCDYIALHWSEISPSDFGNAPRLCQREQLINGSSRWVEFADLNFQISGKRMFKLLQGSGIYRNKLICIREMLQNAVDATIYRLFDEDVLHGESEQIFEQLKKIDWSKYTIEGSVLKENDTHVEIFIRDHGIGISADDIRKIACVSKVRSKKRQVLLDKMPNWYRPSGAFGIGLQSVFLLTDEFVMITKTFNEPPKKVTFQGVGNGKGYIIVEDYMGKFTQGTEIRFTADLTKMTEDELGCSNYHYRCGMLSSFFLRRVMIDYSNQLKLIPPYREVKKRQVADVPIKMMITDYKTDKEILLLELKPFINNEILKNRKTITKRTLNFQRKLPNVLDPGFKLNSINIANGVVHTQIFFNELNCHLSCNISFCNDLLDNHVYGTARKYYSDYKYHNTIFYRHEYVIDDCLQRGIFRENVPLLPYVDWRMDLLGGEADDILNLNRNSVRDEYSKKIYEILMLALKESIKRIIDYLLNQANAGGEKDVKDTILVIYQFAKQLKYRDDELRKEYKGVLKNIMVDNYIEWKAGEKKKLEAPINIMELLRKGKIYFILAELNENIIPEKIKNSMNNELSDSKIVFCLDGGEGSHVLNHRADKLYVMKLDDRYVEIVEAVPMEYLNPMECAIEMHDISLMKQIIRMIKLDIRGIPVLRGYELLASPVSSISQSIKNYVRNEMYIIELPLKACINDMRYSLLNHGYIPDAYSKYFDVIITSKHYKMNVEYIQSYHKGMEGKVKDKYREIIKKILTMLEDENYVRYNRYCLRQYNDPRINNNVLNGRDTLDYNNYLATVVF